MIPKRKIQTSFRSPPCSKCGKSIWMSSLPMTSEKEKEILIGIGWQVNPVVCDECLCPMQPWEREKIKDLNPMLRDIFMFQMIDKYGEQIRKYFE